MNRIIPSAPNKKGDNLDAFKGEFLKSISALKMARLAVYDHNQKETEQPRRFVKRSAGQSLVRRCLAYWLIENAVLRMIPPHEARPVREATTPRPYIPEEMPPAEVEGCRFDDPCKSPAQPRLSFVSRKDRAMQTDKLELVACDLLEMA